MNNDLGERSPLFLRILLFPLTFLGWLLDLLVVASESFERGFQRTAQKLETAVDLAERGDSLLSAFSRVLSGPFFLLGRFFQKGESIISTLGRILVWPLLFLVQLIQNGDWFVSTVLFFVAWPFIVVGRFFSWIGEKLNLGPAARFVTKYTWALWYPFVALAGFCSVLVTTRRVQLYFWTIPVVVIAVPFVLMVMQVSYQQRRSIEARYRRALTAAIEAKQYEQAELFQQKLNQLGTKTEQFNLARAESLAKEGKLDEAYDLLSDLAPLDRPGYPAAHYWIAKNLIELANANQSDQPLLDAQRHVANARKSLRKELPELSYLDALILIRLNKTDAAIKILDSIKSQSLAAAALKLEIDLASERNSDALLDAKVFSVHMQKQPDQTDNAVPESKFFQLWLAAEQLVGTPESANAVILKWINHFPDDPTARAQVAARNLMGLDQILDAAEPMDVLKVKEMLIESSSDLALRDRDIVAQRLIKLESRAKTSQDAKDVIKTLEESPETPSVVLEFLGTQAITQKDYGRAKRLLQRAIDRNPLDHVAWNNMAYLIHEGFPGQLPEALRAANRAIELAPTNVSARETRGMILMALRRWQAAIDDLEIASSGMSDSKKVHLALAEAYRQIGNPSLAEAHTRQAEN